MLRIALGVTILCACLNHLCFAQEKDIQGRVLTRHNMLILLTAKGEGYALMKDPKSESDYNKAKDLADNDADVILSGQETGKTRRFENINYSEGKVKKETYKVFNVAQVKSVITPSKIAQQDIESLMKVGIASEEKILSPTEKSKETASGKKKLAKDAPSATSMSQPRQISMPRPPEGAPVLAEAEGKIVSINPEHSPMPTIELAIKDSEKEVITISVPKGMGVIKGGRPSTFNDLKVGDKIDLWYKEIKDDKIADIITVLP